MKPKFKNVQNELINKKNIKDRSFFHSRSVALVATVLFFNEYTQEHYILLGQRGKGTPDIDQRGKWNLICGYLDWDESGPNGIKREIFEESGVDIDKLINSKDFEVIYNKDFDNSNPWAVQTNSITDRQNVSLHYAIGFKGRYFPYLTHENSEPDEVENIRWIALSEIDDMKEEFAFNHYSRLKQFIEILRK